MLRGQHIIIEMDFDSTDIVGLSYEKVNNKHKNYWGQKFKNWKYGSGES